MAFRPTYTEDDELLNRIQDDIESEFDATDDKLFKVGDIKLSALQESAFRRVHGKNWILCDGRSIEGSDLSKIAIITNAPDLRGRFIKGSSSALPVLTVQAGNAGAAGPDSTIVLNFYIKVS